jgi:hypothetical protein
MPNIWKNQSTPGDIRLNAQEKILTSFIHHEIRSSTKSLLKKQRLFVLVRTEKLTVQLKTHVYGTQSLETSLMEFGEDSLIEKGTL